MSKPEPDGGEPAKILFATSNGTGLGHLNRAMSIARRLPSEIEPVLFTLSQAVPAVVKAGFRVDYHPSYHVLMRHWFGAKNRHAPVSSSVVQTSPCSKPTSTPT